MIATETSLPSLISKAKRPDGILTACNRSGTVSGAAPELPFHSPALRTSHTRTRSLCASLALSNNHIPLDDLFRHLDRVLRRYTRIAGLKAGAPRRQNRSPAFSSGRKMAGGFTARPASARVL